MPLEEETTKAILLTTSYTAVGAGTDLSKRKVAELDFVVGFIGEARSVLELRAKGKVLS